MLEPSLGTGEVAGKVCMCVCAEGGGVRCIIGGGGQVYNWGGGSGV